MTVYTFLGFPRGTYRLKWSDPTVWSTGTPPNSPDADVIIAQTQSGSSPPSSIGIESAFSVRSISASFITLDNGYGQPGALTVSGAVTLANWSNFSVFSSVTQSLGSLAIDATSRISAYGPVIITGLLNNAGAIYGGSPAITAGSFTNTGVLAASITVTGGAGAFTNLSGGVLTGGIYDASTSGINLSVGGAITTDAADIRIANAGSLNTYDSASGTYVPLQNTLQRIAKGGALTVSGGNVFSTATALQVDGSLTLASSMGPYAGSFTSPELDISASGVVSGYGIINGPVVNTGSIVANVYSSQSYGGASATLLVNGPVTGPGILFVGQGDTTQAYGPIGATLEIAGTDTNPVAFVDSTGILKLDNPAGFTGVIIPAATQGRAGGQGNLVSNDQIVLGGVPSDGVSAYSYTGNATGGTLTIETRAGETKLSFLGNYTTASFSLGSAGGNLDITVTPAPSVPTLSLQMAGGVGKVIVNSTTPVLTGSATPGSTVLFAANGAQSGTSGSIYTTAVPGGTSGIYTGATATLPLGYDSVTARASNSAGSAGSDALNLYVLPSPVNNVTTSDNSSFDLAQVLGRGYSFSFVSSTQAVALTNGVLSIGTDTNQAVVQRLYRGLLLRSADTAGLVNFSQQLAGGTNVVVVANGLLSSPEYALRNGAPDNATFVTQLYQSFLGRTPSAGDLTGAVNALSAGQSRGLIASNFATSAEAKAHLSEYTADLWAPDGNGSLVVQVYQTGLAREPGQAETQAWVQQLRAGLSPQQFVQDIAASGEFGRDHSGQSPQDFVMSLYQSGLGRLPGSGELAGWVNQANAGQAPALTLLGIGGSAEAASRLSPAL